MVSQPQSFDTLTYPEFERWMITAARYYEQETMVMQGLMESVTISQGHTPARFPIYPDFEANELPDGQAVQRTQDLAPDFVEAATSRFVIRVIILDSLRDQFYAGRSMVRIAGRQAGEAFPQKFDERAVALFPGLTKTLGGANSSLTAAKLAACVTYSQGKEGDDDDRRIGPVSSNYAVIHPNMLGGVRGDLMSGFNSAPAPQGINNSILNNAYTNLRVGGVPVMIDSNIKKVSGSNSGHGSIFNRAGYIHIRRSRDEVDRRRDLDIYADILQWSRQFGVAVLDESRAIGMRYNMNAPSTT